MRRSTGHHPIARSSDRKQKLGIGFEFSAAQMKSSEAGCSGARQLYGYSNTGDEPCTTFLLSYERRRSYSGPCVW